MFIKPPSANPSPAEILAFNLYAQECEEKRKRRNQEHNSEDEYEYEDEDEDEEYEDSL